MKSTWKTFLPLVKERPDRSLKIDKFKCPYCKSKKLETKDVCTTLVAGRGDANHVWTKLLCLDCKKEFMHEHIDYNTWYTDSNKKILAGIPSCFEDYVYTCSHCGGDVTRKYFEKESEKEVEVLKTKIDPDTGEHIKEYRIVFECESCHKKIESDIEHWYKNCHRRPKLTPPPKTLLPGWTIIEEVGDVIIGYCSKCKINLK